MELLKAYKDARRALLEYFDFEEPSEELIEELEWAR